jgi:hypothetical protein
MKKQNILFKLALAFCLLPQAFSALHAGAPLKLNFQGRLDQSGQPAEGSKTFVFNIYDALSGGTLIWTSETQSVTVTQGAFSTVLSTGATVDLSTSVFAGARYVEITVDGVPLSPLQEMVSAPYALVAQALAPDAELPASSLADGSITDVKVLLTTAAITSGKFSDNRVLITTGAFAALNGADQLVKLDGSGFLPVLNGSALTNVPASSYSGSVNADQIAVGSLGAGVIASSVAVNKVYSGAIQDGAVTDDKVLLTTVAITSGQFGDDRVQVSTGAVNSGKFDDNRVLITTGAIAGGFNGPEQLVRIESTGMLGVSTGVVNSVLSVGGAVSLPIKTVDASISPYTLTANDSTILADGSAGPVQINLPVAAEVAGRVYTIKAVNVDGAVSINSGTDTLDGAAGVYTLSSQWDYAALQSDGIGWFMLGGTLSPPGPS